MSKVTIPKPSTTDGDKNLEPNQYNFFLDAWLYCHKNKLPLTQIKRVSWNIWEVTEA